MTVIYLTVSFIIIFISWIGAFVGSRFSKRGAVFSEPLAMLSVSWSKALKFSRWTDEGSVFLLCYCQCEEVWLFLCVLAELVHNKKKSVSIRFQPKQKSLIWG